MSKICEKRRKKEETTGVGTSKYAAGGFHAIGSIIGYIENKMRKLEEAREARLLALHIEQRRLS